ncbi:ATP-binding protein [Saccharibacillus sp. JS10]|uniref:ATP-binding protein n=1 Tax=Saccharibacillus sp. JS10 TaxID=2950552 RepID=UPI00210CFDBB|nr:ATP-binding protein [Saccharibacillus sp. JS10]MCQ4087130.1 response regulator [Saccharibacillus sp. JS10]
MEAEEKNEIERLNAIIENLNDRIVRGQMKEEKILNEFSSMNNELVTLQRQLAKSHAELEKAVTEAQQANESKSHFLAMISHEFRTPMNGILGMTELLRHSSLKEEQQKWTALVEESASELLGMVNDLLDLSKSEAGALTIEEKPFDLRTVISHVVQLLEPKASAKNNTIEVQVESSIASMLSGDPTRIRQILINLINNANTFTENGKLQIVVSQLESRSDQIRFEIQDSGIGISELNMETLFKSYAQTTAGKAKEGTGLGLMICKSLVDSMQGKIGVSSRENCGSTFWFELNLPQVEVAKDIQPSLHPVAEQSSYPLDLPILVAEDHAINAKVIAMQFKKLGLKSVKVVENGQEAVLAVERGSYALILMDKQMPIMDGTEAARQIRELERIQMRQAIPIIALTGEGTDAEREACLAAGMNDFLSKPLNIETLEHILQKWLPNFSQKLLNSGVIQELIGLDEGEEPEIFRSLVDLYEQETPQQLLELKQLIHDGEIGQALRMAHRLKSGSLSLGVDYFSELLGEVEYRLKEGQISQVEKMLPRLHEVYEAACSELQKFA